MEPKQPIPQIPKDNEEGSFLVLFHLPTEVKKNKQDIETWLNDEDCLDMWSQLKGRSVETIYSYSEQQLERWYGGPRGGGFYNWLHPSQGMLHEGHQLHLIC